MFDKSSHIYRAVSKTVARLWNEPTRQIKRYVIYVLWRHGPRAWYARHRHLLLAHFRPANSVDSSPQFNAKGKLVSVLLPSRGRPQGMLHTISSLIVRSDNPHSMEILLRLDDDDVESHKAAEYINDVFGNTVRIRTIIGPRGEGYRAFHKFVEELCAVARGDFLLLFNDDTVMDTEGWDTKFARFRDEFCVLRLWSPIPRDCSHLTAFPAVHRKVHKVIGHFSLNGFCDAWIQDISRGAGIERFCGVRVTHRQKHDGADPTANDAMSVYAFLSNQLNSTEQKDLRRADLAKINAYLDRHGVQLQRIESAS